VKGKISPYDGFMNPKVLAKACQLALRFDTGAWPNSIRYGLRSIGAIQSVGNFKPTVAKFLWEKHTPAEGGIVYDFSCGWGGRLTGARASKKHLTYVGVDPSQETVNCLMKLDTFLSEFYQTRARSECPPNSEIPLKYAPGVVTTLASGHREYRSELVRITQMGSEDFCPPDLQGKVDFAFSSPPYFDLEQYGGNDTSQSHVKYPGEDLWLTGFIYDTACNVFKLLKPGSFAGVNIADFRDTKICEGVIAQYAKAGFAYRPDQNYYMRISVRTGNRNVSALAGKKHKTETIFMFQKP